MSGGEIDTGRMGGCAMGSNGKMAVIPNEVRDLKLTPHQYLKGHVHSTFEIPRATPSE